MQLPPIQPLKKNQTQANTIKGSFCCLQVKKNSDTCRLNLYHHINMFKQLRDLYKQYKPYVRVDLIMYGVLILMIILYAIYSMAVR